jgi:hypothetical protein
MGFERILMDKQLGESYYFCFPFDSSSACLFGFCGIALSQEAGMGDLGSIGTCFTVPTLK